MKLRNHVLKRKLIERSLNQKKDMEYIFKGLPLTTQLIHDKINKQEYFESIKTELFVIYYLIHITSKPVHCLVTLVIAIVP